LSYHERGEQVLRELGLTFSQAKLYIALTKLGKPCTAKMASDSSHVARQDAYRIIAELQQLGLIEKVIGKPTRFKTAPIHEALSLLLENRKSKTVSIQEEVSQLVADFSANEHDTVFEEDKDQFVLASEKTAFVRMVKKAVESAQKSMLVITSWKECVQLLSILSETWNKAFKSGVHVQWLIEQPTNGNSIQELATALSNPNFSLRILNDIPVARLCVYDGTGAFIAVPSTSNGTQMPAFWTNNKTLVSLMAEYFEMKYNQAAAYQGICNALVSVHRT
jgi:sugar-specific transcriptional regulator TrmB